MSENTEKDKFDDIRQRLKDFPTGPGLYFMKGASDKVLYIGKAKSLRSRASSYFQPAADLMTTRGPKIVEMINKVRTVDYLEAKSEVDAILQEARLIKDIRPPYNTDLVDNKTFPYLEITTRDQYPSVYVTRNPKNPRSKFFGPFTSARDLRAVMVVLQKIFKFRTCSLEIKENDDKRRFFRPCLLYSIKQCTAPCADKISRDNYRKHINDVIKFMTSKRSAVLKQMQNKMAAAATNMDYEAAGMYRDRIRLIERLDERGSVDQHVQPELFAADPTEALTKLQKLLGTETPIRTIEGFDIAHLQGTETVASMVQFIDGKPFKSGYRRFKINTVRGIDDYASMKEVLTRRYKKAVSGETLWPDLVLIDGGLGHLHTAEQAFFDMGAPLPLLASIAKREEEIFIHGRKTPIKLPPNSPARKLLQYIRDEAHRFAQHYHHLLRSKNMFPKK